MKQLSERSRQILRSLITLYIQEGEPVGSKRLSQLPDLALSSASIRNVMAELETAGLVVSPHTSSGRVPTDKGYRLFVDSLLTVKPLNDATVRGLLMKEVSQPTLNQQQLVQSVSNVLSGLTQMAGLVTVPKHNEVCLKQIEFIKLSSRRVLVVLVLNNMEVQNRIMLTSREHTSNELIQAGNYLTRHFCGKPLADIRQHLLSTMEQDKAQLDQAMDLVLSAAHTFEGGFSDTNYAFAGQGNLLGMMDDQGVDHLKKLFEAFSEKRTILQLLDQCIQAEGVQIYIGEESGFDACSLVTKTYRTEDNAIGIIGVIGPTRMDYSKVISVVDTTSKVLSLALSQA